MSLFRFWLDPGPAFMSGYPLLCGDCLQDWWIAELWNGGGGGLLIPSPNPMRNLMKYARLLSWKFSSWCLVFISIRTNCPPAGTVFLSAHSHSSSYSYSNSCQLLLIWLKPKNNQGLLQQLLMKSISWMHMPCSFPLLIYASQKIAKVRQW